MLTKVVRSCRESQDRIMISRALKEAIVDSFSQISSKVQTWGTSSKTAHNWNSVRS